MKAKAVVNASKKAFGGAKAVANALTMPNTIENGGGMSSLLIRRRLNPLGGAVVVGGLGAATVAHEGFKGHNRAKLGKITYADGPARMTNSFTSGAVQAMHRASGGNYAVFSDMAEDVVKGQGTIGGLDTYGATPELVSALYNMGGR